MFLVRCSNATLLPLQRHSARVTSTAPFAFQPAAVTRFPPVLSLVGHRRRQSGESAICPVAPIIKPLARSVQCRVPPAPGQNAPPRGAPRLVRGRKRCGSSSEAYHARIVARRRACDHSGLGTRMRPRHARLMPAALPADWSAIRAQAVSGVPLASIADATGISLGTLKARSAREGWQRATADAKALVSAKAVRAVSAGRMLPRATDATAMASVATESTLQRRKGATRLALSRFAQRASARAATLPSTRLLSEASNVKAVSAVAAQVWPEERHEQGPAPLVNIAVLLQGLELCGERDARAVE